MQTDWQERYRILAEFLGNVLGPDYEVVVHDLSGGDHHIIAIANPQVSGRRGDTSLSNLAIRFILQKEYKDRDYQLNYEGVAVDGRKLRCSTMFIKDTQGNLLGMLCINFDASKYARFANDVLQFFQRSFPMDSLCATGSGGEAIENFSGSVAQCFASVVFKMFGDAGLPSHLTIAQKTRLIEELDSCGVFQMKGSVNEAALLIHSSVASVYRYLTKTRKEADEGEQI